MQIVYPFPGTLTFFTIYMAYLDIPSHFLKRKRDIHVENTTKNGNNVIFLFKKRENETLEKRPYSF